MMGLCTVGVHGIDNGLIPIAAYNYGAGKPDRIQASVRWALIDSCLFYLAFLLLLELLPATVLRLFNASDHMLEIGIPAVRILAAAWLAAIPAQVFASAMQGLSLPRPSMILTLLRQAVLPVLFALALRLTGWLPAVWLSFVLAELVCLPLAIAFWRKNWGRIRRSIRNDA